MSTPTNQLGRLDRVTLRDVWADEARDFTPWLAREDNIALLGDVIGIELEVEAQEQNVGPFPADILGKDTSNDTWVLIENQLERTDHNHLGQLMTYAAGLKAVTIVWIAQRFTEEHREAMDWLNSITDSDFNFFGLEVELWRIGGSAVAPKFNVICKPNDWSKAISSRAKEVERGGLTETRQIQLEYWTKFWALLEERGNTIRGTKPRPQSWNNFSVGRSNFGLQATVNIGKKFVRVLAICSEPNAMAHFELLRKDKERIEAEVGASLEWAEMPEKKEIRIILRKLDTDPANKADWPAQHAWLADKLERFHRVFAPRIRLLDAENYVPEDAEDEDGGEDGED